MQTQTALLRFLTLLVPAIALGPTPIASAQQALWEAGTVTCSVLPEAGFSQQGEAGKGAEKREGRESLCRFRPGSSGAEETYIGRLQFISQSAGALSVARTVMLTVKAPLAAALAPGALEQSYAADVSTAAGSQPPLVGQRNSSLVLQPEPGSVEPSLALGDPKAVTLIVLDLKLQSSPA